jgi:putative copper export protein
MTNLLLMFIHVLSAGVAVGSLAYSLLLLLPKLAQDSAKENTDATGARIRILQLTAPTAFACVLVLIGTGVIYLFETYTAQVNLKSEYYNLLGVKMASATGAFLLSAYLAFPLRSRLADLDLVPENRQRLPQTLDKMQSVGKLLLGLVTLTLFLGVWLARF